MVSSTKPEVHNISQGHQRRTKPRVDHRQHATKIW